MSNNEYTPTTSFVRREYITGRLRRSDGTAPEARSEFDRWLAEVERAGAEKAWDEGEIAGYEDALAEQRGIESHEYTSNPYSKTKGEHDD